jgi:hypothetical protein
MLGSVGGALVSLLGLFSTPYVLALPLVLPIVSLFASLQREGLIAAVRPLTSACCHLMLQSRLTLPFHNPMLCGMQDNRRHYSQLVGTAQIEAQSVLKETKALVDDIRRELRAQSTGTARFAALEGRLSSLEGSILSTSEHNCTQLNMLQSR